MNIVAGPRVELQFDGAVPPRKSWRKSRTQWNRGVFDSQRIDDSNEVVTGWLMDDNYLQPQVRTTVHEVPPGPAQRRLSHSNRAALHDSAAGVRGRRGIRPKELDDIVNQQGLERELFTDPAQVTELLERYYHEQGYLIADVAAPEYRYEGAVARVVLNVQEGPRFLVRT